MTLFTDTWDLENFWDLEKFWGVKKFFCSKITWNERKYDFEQKKICPQNGQDLENFQSSPEKKLSPDHFGGKIFFTHNHISFHSR